MSKQILTTLNRLKKLAYSQLKIEQAEFFEDWQQNIATHWHAEPADVPRAINGMKFRGDRLKSIGNGQVSIAAAAAFLILEEIK